MKLRRRRVAATASLLAGLLVVGLAAPAAAAAPPTLSSAAPQPAPAGAGVTITGSGLAGTTALDFAGRAAPFTVIDDTSLSTTVPAGATDGPLTVTTADGSATLPFDVDEPDVAPSPVVGLTARPGDRAVGLRWTLPGDGVTVIVRRAEGSTPPGSPNDGVEVARGPISEVVDPNLVNGVTYAYAVWVVDAAGSTSAPSTVTSAPAVPAADLLRIGLSARTVTHGAVVSVTGVLTSASGGAVPGASVVLLARLRGSTYAGVVRATTDAAGVVRFAYRAVGHAELALRRPGDAFSAETLTAPVPLDVRHGLATRLSAGVVQLGSAALVDGRVAPGTPGVRVRLQRQTGGVWATAAETAVDSTGGFRLSVRPTATGEQLLRVVTLGAPLHLPATGPTWRLVTLARTLRQGHSGPDVLAVEHRLTDLRYDVGPVSGVFDYDTRLAVMAFQKVHGLPRTGIVDAATRTRLANPSTPRLRHPVLGLSVEIDLTRQVLYFARSGSIQRILPVSTGNNALYTVDGVTSRAVTPVGSYRVTRKINAVRVSRLGELFQPAYFVGGYAIHGSPSVPAYPASHGCVRVTKSAMSRLFPLLPVGTPVRLYYG
ncbi:MAG TPA: L,D-transpeptidase family protein [Mycobacteriales bacterium]|nr:L,D-transpeptidase family protein [Mycobacteriales bacterium]